MAIIDQEQRLAANGHIGREILVDLMKVVKSKLGQFVVVVVLDQKLTDGAEGCGHSGSVGCRLEGVIGIAMPIIVAEQPLATTMIAGTSTLSKEEG